jgi:multidrug efflux pump subunit AcrB
MAIAIIFGLLFATALTLGVVPVLYSLFFRVGFKAR